MVRFIGVVAVASGLAAAALPARADNKPPAVQHQPAPIAPTQTLYDELSRIVEAEIKANDKQHVGTPNPFMKPRARPSRQPRPALPSS